ncbi:MAG: hypothetical protein JSR27_11960 [Proteobacteria bacterium]|nr:hypothetical protein [Pseudomonadota bacterium]
MKVTDEMVTRFLGWKLPQDFLPDCGISFTPYMVGEPLRPLWPIGTNLLHAGQARAMLEHVLCEATDGDAAQGELATLRAERDAWRKMAFEAVNPCHPPEVQDFHKNQIRRRVDALLAANA